MVIHTWDPGTWEKGHEEQKFKGIVFIFFSVAKIKHVDKGSNEGRIK